MGKLRLVIAALILAVSPLVWAATVGPPAQPVHTHDHSGKETTVLTRTISVPAAEATFGVVQAEGENLNTHVLLRVQLRTENNNIHAECWALDNGGVHHAHRINSCSFYSTSGAESHGSCSTGGGYGPCSSSTENQHWHAPALGPAVNCYYAVGTFSVSTHTPRTVYAPPGGYYWCVH